MNRIYRLVWNRSLAALQVASELTRAQGSCASGSAAPRLPRRNALALAVAGIALACSSAPAWSQTCTPAAPSGCGAAGGTGGHPGRDNNGGAGNGTGGDATLYNVNTGTSETAGSTADSIGDGGNGADGVFESGTTITAPGGTGGAVGAIGSAGLSASVTGGAGNAGTTAPSGSFFGGGGGGGGAGGYVNDGGSSSPIPNGVVISGGAGGAGGDATVASNADPGAGGGGGAGVIIGISASNKILTNYGTLIGGAGGNGGTGGYSGSGGGGGDGLLVLGAGAQFTNAGTITGGAGGSAGTATDGSGTAGGFGGGGTGVNLVGAGDNLTNTNSITGGASNPSPISSFQDGAPGIGVQAWGSDTVITSGSIAGGSNGNGGYGDAVLFSGGGNVLAIEPGATFTGNIVSTSGTTDGGDTLELAGAGNGTIDAGLIVGFATNIKTGTSTWTLTGTGNTGVDWTILQGTLAISSDANLGDDSNVLTLAGGTLENTSAFTSTRAIGLASAGGTLQTDDDLTLSGNITGLGGLTKTGPGTLTLAGTNNYTGGTNIEQGTLQGTTSSLQGNITDNATLAFTQNTDGSYIGNITGTGSLTVNGTGTVTLAGTDSYTGGTMVSAGTLEGDTASLQGTIVDNATVAFDQATNGTYSGLLAGTGALVKTGTGTVTMTGANTYSGNTTIDAGTLILDGANTNTGLTTVASGATLIVGDSSHTTATEGGASSVISVAGGTLGGYGAVLGSVTLSNSATLTPGEAGAIGTLTIDGDLTIGDGSQLDFDFGAPGPNFSTPGQSDHVVVGGSLSIGSTTLNVNNLGSMGPGLYELFSWTNSLSITGGGFQPPSGMSLQILTIDKQINLVDNQGVTLDAWDANGLASATQMGGGSGTWSVASDTWANTNGQYVGPMAPQPGFAIFGGASGTVTVDDTNGQVSVTGMQFVSDGYHLTGDAVDLVEQNGTAPVLRVSSGDTAIIDNVLEGTDGFDKTDGGTLVLTGSNTYTGTTTLTGGYLSVSSDANLGAAADPLDFEGGTLEITGTAFTQTARTITWGSPGGGFDIDDAANTFTVAQALTGTGGLLKSGAGTLVLSGANTYSGGTVVSAGTLQGDTSSLQGAITNNATVVFAQQSNGTYAGGMSGTGALIKTGSGTLTLSGANSYSGGTTVSTGTLQGDTTSLQGSIINNATVVFTQQGDGTYAGTMSGTGALVMSGSGTLTLSGANTYSGGTTISAGTLQGDASSLQGAIANNATVVFTQQGTGTYAGAMSGTGALIMSGSGTLTLTGANTYTGGTTVSAGTLQGDTTSLQGNIVNNASVAFAQQSDGTYAGVMSGSGNLIKSGSGTLTLSGANTYSGGTTVSAGTLQGDASSLQGAITNNATVVFTQQGTGTYAGAMSGTGALIMSGSGTLTLTGANTYTGGTTINAGTLIGNTSTLQGTITNNATLVFNQASDGTYSDAISGSGGLSKTGAGSLILDGANTYTGTTTVSAGTLEVGDSDHASASIDGAVDVQAGGTLRGHGTINGNVVDDGIVWAGGSVGVLTIQGNYTQNADGTLQLDVTPTQASTLVVSGTASLAGTLNLIFAPGTYSASTFTLLHAGVLNGTFTTVDGTAPGSLTSQISYTSTDADLVLSNNRIAPLDGSLYGNLMRSVALAGQQDLSSVLDVGLMSHDTNCASDNSPSMQNVSASACRGGAWAQYTGSSLSLGGANGLNSTAFGLLGGADYAVGDVAHLGLQAGVGQINGNDTSGGNGRVDNVHGGFYAYAYTGPLVLSAVVDDMHSEYHFNRATGIGTATSTPDGNTLSGAVQAAWPLQVLQWQLTPEVGVLYQHQKLDGFSETLVSSNPDAADFPVTGSRSSYIALQPYAAMAIEHSFVAQGVTYVPQLSLGYRYDTRNTATPFVQVTAQDGTAFALPGAAQGRGLGTASARITAEAGASWSLYLDYQGLFGDRVHDNALSFGFTKRF